MVGDSLTFTRKKPLNLPKSGLGDYIKAPFMGTVGHRLEDARVFRQEKVSLKPTS